MRHECQAFELTEGSEGDPKGERQNTASNPGAPDKNRGQKAEVRKQIEKSE